MLQSLTLEPIGYVRTGKQVKFDAPHQPDSESGETNVVELVPGRQFHLALEDLSGFDHIWLIWWFHKNNAWRPRALPPRGPAKRRGLFATRSPHRPNPIGLTCVPLLSVNKLTLTVGPLDLVDGTPILDIKPYIRTIDSFPEASLGWIDEINRALETSTRFRIEVNEPAKTKLAWLIDHGVDFTERAFDILSIDPKPHRTRRILDLGDGRHRMACGPWRLFFRVQGEVVSIEEIGKGYSEVSLTAPGFEKIPDRDVQVLFAQTFREV